MGYSASSSCDFAYRLLTSDSKSRYFQGVRLGGSGYLPFPQVKVLRIFRLMRVFRLLRGYGIKGIARSLVADRAGSALFTLLLMGILVLEFGSLWILHLEQYAPDANITSASDALWYVIVTPTVGYGDQFPVTDTGRVVGSSIIIIGVGIFGTFTGYLANVFLSPRKERSARHDAGLSTDTSTNERPPRHFRGAPNPTRCRLKPRQPLAEGDGTVGLSSFDWVGSRVALLLGLVA